ncbi:hypothetical protein QOT17_005162 [Balamuthia mandrillaris]
MLVGGMDLLGIYVVAPQKTFVEGSPKVNELLFGLAACLRAKRSPPLEDLLVLHFDPSSQLFSAQAVNVYSKKGASKKAVLRFQSVADSFQCYQAIIAVDIHIPLTNGQSISKQIEAALEAEQQKILESIALVDGVPVPAIETVIDGGQAKKSFSQKKNKNKNKLQGGTSKASSTSAGMRCVQLLTPFSMGQLGEGQTKEASFIGKIRYHGHLCGRAYLYTKEQQALCVEALKMDLANSLALRFEFLQEELARREEEENGGAKAKKRGQRDYFNPFAPSNKIPLTSAQDWALPLRVFVKLAGAVYLSDYVLPFETEAEQKERCQAMLGINMDALSSKELFQQVESFSNQVTTTENHLELAKLQPTVATQKVGEENQLTQLRQRSNSQHPQVSKAETKIPRATLEKQNIAEAGHRLQQLVLLSVAAIAALLIMLFLLGSIVFTS